MPYKDKGHGGNYMIDVSLPGWRNGRFKKSSGVTAKKTADAYESAVRDLHSTGAFDCLDAVADGEISFAKLSELRPQGVNAIRDHLEELARKKTATEHTIVALLVMFTKDQLYEVREKTLNGYVTHIRRFAQWVQQKLGLPSPTTIEHLTPALIKQWRDHVVSAGVEGERAKGIFSKDELNRKLGEKRATANRHLNGLGAFCTVLVEQGILTSNPTSGLRFTDENPAREDTYRYMTPVEFERFHDASLQCDSDQAEADPGSPRPDTLFWEFLVTTGATTWTEGCWLLRRNIHLEEDHAHDMVRVSLAGTKSRYRSRDVYIPRWLAVQVEAHCDRHRIGLSDRIFPFTHDDYLKVFQAIIDRLVVDGHVRMGRFSPYDLRHTFAVSAVKGDPENGRAGIDLPTLQVLLGHNNIETTMKYAKHQSNLDQYGCRMAAESLGLWRKNDA